MKNPLMSFIISGVIAVFVLSSCCVDLMASESTGYDQAWAQALSQVSEQQEAAAKAALQAQQEAIAKAALQAQQEAAAKAALQAQQEAAAKAALQAQQEAAAKAALAAQQEAAQAAQIKAQQDAAAQATAAQIAAQQEAAAQAVVPQEGMPGTYIDVSIDNQTLVYFVNGTPVIIAPCVTGSPGRGTPKGVFAINSMIPGKRLVGPTWNVWVNRWMRFSGNCGIHDANWRKKFGGDIYRHNGSHGCVNIPYDQALQLYSMVGIGTTVIVH